MDNQPNVIHITVTPVVPIGVGVGERPVIVIVRVVLTTDPNQFCGEAMEDAERTSLYRTGNQPSAMEIAGGHVVPSSATVGERPCIANVRVVLTTEAIEVNEANSSYWSRLTI